MALLMVTTAMATATPATAAAGPGLRRAANMPDGAPAFDVRDARGVVVARIECVFNGWYDSNTLAARLMAEPVVMAAVLTKQGRITIDDLGSAKFDCVVSMSRVQP
jgi:porphobilinogen deaminase